MTIEIGPIRYTEKDHSGVKTVWNGRSLSIDVIAKPQVITTYSHWQKGESKVDDIETLASPE